MSKPKDVTALIPSHMEGKWEREGWNRCLLARRVLSDMSHPYRARVCLCVRVHVCEHMCVHVCVPLCLCAVTPLCVELKWPRGSYQVFMPILTWPRRTHSASSLDLLVARLFSLSPIILAALSPQSWGYGKLLQVVCSCLARKDLCVCAHLSVRGWAAVISSSSLVTQLGHSVTSVFSAAAGRVAQGAVREDWLPSLNPEAELTRCSSPASGRRLLLEVRLRTGEKSRLVRKASRRRGLDASPTWVTPVSVTRVPSLLGQGGPCSPSAQTPPWGSAQPSCRARVLIILFPCCEGTVIVPPLGRRVRHTQ